MSTPPNAPAASNVRADVVQAVSADRCRRAGLGNLKLCTATTSIAVRGVPDGFAAT